MCSHRHQHDSRPLQEGQRNGRAGYEKRQLDALTRHKLCMGSTVTEKHDAQWGVLWRWSHEASSRDRIERALANGCSAKGAQAMNSASTTRTWTAGMPETSKEAAHSSPTAQATAAHSTRLCSSVPAWRPHLRLALQGRCILKVGM